MAPTRRLPRWSRILLAVLGLFWAGFFAPTSVGAQEPAFQFIGLVFPNADGQLATKVRALGEGGVVCGTADIEAINDEAGYYELPVASADERAGCPRPNELVNLVLLYGDVGDGIAANGRSAFLYPEPGHTTLVSLTSGSLTAPVFWLGDVPPPGGLALMIWSGPDRAPAGFAAEAFGTPISGMYTYDATARQYRSYIPNAPAFAQTLATVNTGDIVIIRR